MLHYSLLLSTKNASLQLLISKIKSINDSPVVTVNPPSQQLPDPKIPEIPEIPTPPLPPTPGQGGDFT